MSENIGEVGTELRRAITRLCGRVLSERFEDEVTDAALFVLIHLEKQDGMSLTNLAETARVTLGSMSQTVRRLAELSYVTKTRGTEDRRKVVFALTTQGKAAVTTSRARHHFFSKSPTHKRSTLCTPAEALLAPLGKAFRNRHADENPSIDSAAELASENYFAFTSPNSKDGEDIPAQFCGWFIGDNVSPALTWGTLPAGTMDLMLLMEELNSPRTIPSIHTIAEFAPTEGGFVEGTVRITTASTSTHSSATAGY